MNSGSFVQRIPSRSTRCGPLRHPSTQMGLKYVTWKQTNQTPKASYGVILFTHHSGKEKMTGKIGTGFDDTRHHQALFLVGGWAALTHLGYGDDHVTLYIRQNVQNPAQKVNFTIYKWKTALKIQNQIYPWPKVIHKKKFWLSMWYNSWLSVQIWFATVIFYVISQGKGIHSLWKISSRKIVKLVKTTNLNQFVSGKIWPIWVFCIF